MRCDRTATFALLVLIVNAEVASGAEPIPRCKTFREVCGIQKCGVECGDQRLYIPCGADVFTGEGFEFDILEICGAPTFGADARRHIFDLAMGSSYRAERELEIYVLEVAVATPGFFVGRTRFDPSFRLGTGHADVDLSREFGSETRTIYSERGNVFSLGGELLLTPCLGCRWYAAGDYSIRSIGSPQAHKNQGIALRTELDHLRAYDAGVRIGYGFFDNRVALTVGTRVTHLEADIDQTIRDETLPTLKFDSNRQKLVAGIDFRLSHRFLGRLEFSPGGA